MLKPFTSFKYEGSGAVTFEDGYSINVKFVLQLHKNGLISGELEFPTFDVSLWSYLNKMTIFILKGQENRDRRNLRAEGCILAGLNESERKGKFGAHEVLIDNDILDSRIKGKLHLHYGILNLYEVFGGACVDTNLGQLKLINYTDIRESEKLMSLYHMPLITSSLQFLLELNGLQSLRDILDGASKTVYDFLKITSLAQTIRHDWVLLEVSEVLDEETLYIRPILHKLRSPALKSPHIRMNTTAVYFEHFVRSAWRGYSVDIEEKYGFDMALEWYIQSNNGGSLETRFLNATTRLELLMEKFHSVKGTNKLFDEESFRNFYNSMKAHAKKLLSEMGVDDRTQQAVYGSMKGMERRTYLEKFEILLKNWGISYSDLGITLSEIKDVRNKITHEGRYYDKVEIQSQVDYLVKVYNGLFNILTRLFLAMLNYDGKYYDIPNSKWIEFEDVCSKTLAENDLKEDGN